MDVGTDSESFHITYPVLMNTGVGGVNTNILHDDYPVLLKAGLQKWEFQQLLSGYLEGFYSL